MYQLALDKLETILYDANRTLKAIINAAMQAEMAYVMWVAMLALPTALHMAVNDRAICPQGKMWVCLSRKKPAGVKVADDTVNGKESEGTDSEAKETLKRCRFFLRDPRKKGG